MKTKMIILALALMGMGLVSAIDDSAAIDRRMQREMKRATKAAAREARLAKQIINLLEPYGCVSTNSDGEAEVDADAFMDVVKTNGIPQQKLNIIFAKETSKTW